MSNNLGDACSICDRSEWMEHNECKVCITCGIPTIVKYRITYPTLPVDVTSELSDDNERYKEFLRLLSQGTK